MALFSEALKVPNARAAVEYKAVWTWYKLEVLGFELLRRLSRGLDFE